MTDTSNGHDFAPMQNDLILRAARGESVTRVPVWCMRQAGRYMHEFREVREKHEFFNVCRSPQLACEVTLQPLKVFDLDAAILFSDILVIPQALGMEVQMIKGKGPVFPDPINTPTDLEKLNEKVNVKESLKYVYDAITLVRKTLAGKVPLIGFAGAPWTVMVYMIEGGSSKTHSKAKRWLYMYPEESRQLLQLITNVTIDYLVEQVKAGAQLLQVFDSHAGELPEDKFNEFVLPTLIEIVDKVKERITPDYDVPMIVFAKGAHYALENLAKTRYEVIALDWTVDRKRARQLAPNKTLMGNLDPCAMYADENVLDSCVGKMVEEFGVDRYIANLGHGMYPDMPRTSVEIFTNAVHKHSEAIINTR